MPPEACGEWAVEGKAHENDFHPVGSMCWGSEVRLSFKISLYLPHHSWLVSFLLRASPEAHLLLPQGQVPSFQTAIHPYANTHLNYGPSFCSTARLVLEACNWLVLCMP